MNTQIYYEPKNRGQCIIDLGRVDKSLNREPAQKVHRQIHLEGTEYEQTSDN